MKQLKQAADRRRFAAALSMALALAAANASAQDVTIVPTLRVGDSFRLEVIRTRETSAQPQQNSKGRTLVDIRVISANADGFEIEWVPGDTVLDNPRAMDPMLAAASQALRDIRFRLKLSVDGELEGMANQAEVAPKLKTVVDTIVRELSARIPEEQRKTFLDFIGQVLTVDVLIASSIRDAATYFGLNGASLTAGEAVEVDIEQPNPLGGGTIPATFMVLMESASADSALLKTTTTYDPAALARMTESIAKRAGAPISPEQLAKLPPIQMADEGTFLFDRTIGLMRDVKVKRQVIVESNRRLDAWDIRLIRGPR